MVSRNQRVEVSSTSRMKAIDPSEVGGHSVVC